VTTKYSFLIVYGKIYFYAWCYTYLYDYNDDILLFLYTYNSFQIKKPNTRKYLSYTLNLRKQDYTLHMHYSMKWFDNLLAKITHGEIIILWLIIRIDWENQYISYLHIPKLLNIPRPAKYSNNASLHLHIFV
jgi:hypothetical protein